MKTEKLYIVQLKFVVYSAIAHDTGLSFNHFLHQTFMVRPLDEIMKVQWDQEWHDFEQFPTLKQGSSEWKTAEVTHVPSMAWFWTVPTL